MYSSSRLSFLALCVATVACNNYVDQPCANLVTGESCVDWSQGQDVQLVTLPYDEEGNGLVAATRDGQMVYDPDALAYVTYAKTSTGATHVSIADHSGGASTTPQMLPQGTKISQDRWFTVTQDVSYNKRMYGCVNGRVVDVKMNTRIMVVNQDQPALDIHFAYYRDEAGRKCWALYNSGIGSTGPGVCYCEDDDNPAPPDVKRRAIRQEVRNEIPADMSTSLRYAAMAIVVGGAVAAMMAPINY